MGKKSPAFTCNLTTTLSHGALSQDYWIVAKYVNKIMAGIDLFWPLMLFFSQWFWLKPFSAVAFYCHFKLMMQNLRYPKGSWREFDVTRIRARLGWLPNLETFAKTGFDPGWEVFPVWQTGAIRLGGSPHLSCKRDQMKIRDGHACYLIYLDVNRPLC